jgi:phage FluMu protein Com
VGFTRVETVRKSKEWNFREAAIECVAVHPKSHSLPLFASGSRNAVQVWDESKREPEPLVVQPQVTPVISVGFNENFLAVCDPSNVHIYSGNAEDYNVYKQNLQNESNALGELGEFSNNVALANRQGEDCIICGEPMNDPLSQPALRSGPKEAQEIYLTCGHKFHNNDSCIKGWIKQGRKCPLCKQTNDFAVGTPQRILQQRKEEMTGRIKKSIKDTNEQRFMRALDYGGHIAQGSPLRLIRYNRNLVQPQASDIASSAPEAVAEPPVSAELTPNRLRAARLAYFSKQQQQQQPPSENRGGSKQNKYSRKKYSSKKSKIRNYYTSSKNIKNIHK